MRFFSLFFFILILTFKSTFSGPFSDNLAQCMIKNISDTDNRILTNWMASVMVQHPQIDIEMSPSDIEFYNRSIALLFEDLLTVRCKQETAEALIVKAADAISASRPGARQESFDKYIERMTLLTETANSFNGVKKAYAISAGREVRVFVDPENVKDDSLRILAKQLAEKIEEDVVYPGKIKVNAIRRTKHTEIAK